MLKYVIAILTFMLLNITVSFGQKVKLKKDKVLVDKEHKFDFVEIEQESSKLKHYILKDMEGNEVLSLKDTSFYYTQLPNESSKRVAYEAYVCKAPQLGLSKLIPFNKIRKYRKQRIKDLKKTDFFKDFNLTEERFNEFVEKQGPQGVVTNLEQIDLVNTNREKNYNLTKEMFGPLLERDPSRIRVLMNPKKSKSYKIVEGSEIVAYVNLKNAGSYSHSYNVVNKDNVEIAAINIFQKSETKNLLERKKYNVVPHVFGQNKSQDNFIWFYENVGLGRISKSVNNKIEEIADYLIRQGLL